MKHPIRAAAAIAAATLTALAMGPIAAAADDRASTVPDDNYGLIEVAPLPGVESARAADPGSDSPIPQAYHEALWRLGYTGALDQVNAIEWNDDKQQLVLYFHGDPAPLARAVGAELPSDAFAIATAEHSKAEVDAVLAAILNSGGALTDGVRVATAAAAPDGSSITIGIEGDVDAGAALFAAQLRGSTVPLEFEEAADIQQATRNVNSSIRFGGAYMQTSGRSCTTGFAIGSFTVSGAVGMMSADHCGRDTTGDWRYSSSSSSTAIISPYQGMLTVSPGTPVDLGLWYGAGTAGFYPYIFTGNYTDVSTLSAIKGSVQPVLGDKVCYSGSRSGRVCDNTVVTTGFLVCYSITQCYAGTTITTQDSSIESAGNGDSGGPVYASVSGQAYAAGIISGIVGGSSTCTGDPGASGGRQCSPTAIYEPHVYGLGPSTTTWGLLIVP